MLQRRKRAGSSTACPAWSTSKTRVAAFRGRTTPASVAHIMRTYPDEFRVTEAMIQSDFDTIAPLAREGGYPFPELKLMQDQVQVLFDKSA